MSHEEKKIMIDRFVTETEKLLGKEVWEKPLWNTCVSRDAIYHFARGVGDDNPLYLDPDYGQKSSLGRQFAPPAFLTSVLYPIFHGASMSVPLWFLAGELMYQWFLPIDIGDNLRAIIKPIDLFDTAGSLEDRKIFILSETCYLNQDDLVVGKCISTTVCVPENNGHLLVERPIYKYSEEEIDNIGTLLEMETRNGGRRLHDNELKVGCKLPTFVRPPLTIGDMICWQSAIGPTFQAGAPGFRQLAKSLRSTGKHPVTGWPVSSSQQHEDFLLSPQRGMPFPFDYGAMRLACLTPMVTNWMGDNGFLNSLSMKFVAPILYGDATWYHGIISERTDYDDGIFLKLKIIGKNQLGETTTEAEAGLTLPREGVLSVYYRNRSRDKNIEKKVPDSFKTAIDFFEDQAARHPDAFALVFGKTRMTYKELNCQADRLARKLLLLGVVANTTVAVCMDRSHRFIIAIFGILKVGAAYVPMDTLTPQKRLVEMCDDCRADVIIVDDSGARVLEGYRGKMVFMDSLLEDTNRSGQPHIDRKMNKEDLAYIMYTSGSVGKAKGVAVTQGNLSSYLLGLNPILGIDVGDIYLHSASFAFSASVRQIFLPLCSGASLVIADTEQRWEPIATASLIQREGVTHWDTVPSFLHLCCDTFMKLDSIKNGELLNNKLKHILVTGEPLMWEVPFLWNQTLKHSAKIINLYSQTETSGTVCLYEVPPNSATVKGVVPIGFPIPDTAVYLLGENLRPVSYGEVGEICVAGPRVSRGYLNLPELTAGHFIDNPFCAGSEFKLYRTGDLGLYLPDGIIMTKGRRDRRVKIRGFRVELEEIEKALRTHPGIRQAVTVASDGNGREAQLLAYFVPKGETAPTQGELRTFVQAILPDYMLPAHFILLEELPLNSNGKVNYSALPLPDGTRPEISSTFVKPRTSVEKALTEVWNDILGLDNVGIHDNFFELGGNSLSATRMLFKVRHLFQIEIPLRSIFETPTVEGLSLFITQSFMGNQLSDESLNIIDELDEMSDEEAVRLLEKESGSMDVGYAGH